MHDPPFGCPSECSKSEFLVDAVQDVVVINFFDSLDPVKRFAGPDYQVAEFEPEARRLLSRIEPVANHYETCHAAAAIADGYARSRFLSISLIFQSTQSCKGTGAPKCANPAAMAAVRKAP